MLGALAQRHDNVLAELLVGLAITTAPEDDARAAGTFGGFRLSRFTEPRPDRIEVAAAAQAALVYAPKR